MKTDAEIDYRDATDKKKCCHTCMFFYESDHRADKGECEHEENLGDTKKGMLCDLWTKK